MARWKDDHLWARAHAERAALAEDLAGPSAEQWRHGTLCGQADFLARRDFTVVSRTHVAGLQLRRRRAVRYGLRSAAHRIDLRPNDEHGWPPNET